MAATPQSPWANKYLSDGKGMGIFTDETYRLKRQQLARFEKFNGGVPAHDLNAEQIRAFIDRKHVRTGKPLAKLTRWTTFMILKQFFLWLSDEIAVDQSVLRCLDGCPFTWRLPPQPCYSVAEVEALFKAAAEDSGRPAIACRNTMMLHFAYYMTLRTSSITSIKLSSVDFETMTCMAYFKNQDMQLVEIPSWMIDRLREYVEEYRPLLFVKNPDKGYLFPSNRGDRLKLETCSDLMSSIVTAAGISRPAGRGLHGLRRAGLTHAMIYDKMPLHVVSKGLAKHASVKTTQGYLGTTPEVMRESVNSTTMHPIHGNTQRKLDREHQKRVAREIAKEKKI